MLFVLKLCLAYHILVKVLTWSSVMQHVCIQSKSQVLHFVFFSDVERHLLMCLKPSGIPHCYFSAMNIVLKCIKSQHCM